MHAYLLHWEPAMHTSTFPKQANLRRDSHVSVTLRHGQIPA